MSDEALADLRARLERLEGEDMRRQIAPAARQSESLRLTQETVDMMIRSNHAAEMRRIQQEERQRDGWIHRLGLEPYVLFYLAIMLASLVISVGFSPIALTALR